LQANNGDEYSQIDEAKNYWSNTRCVKKAHSCANEEIAEKWFVNFVKLICFEVKLYNN